MGKEKQICISRILKSILVFWGEMHIHVSIHTGCVAVFVTKCICFWDNLFSLTSIYQYNHNYVNITPCADADWSTSGLFQFSSYQHS